MQPIFSINAKYLSFAYEKKILLWEGVFIIFI